MQINLDRHNARQNLTYYVLPHPPHFSLPSTFKASFADSLHFDGEPYPYQSGRLVPDPHHCDRSDPEPRQSEKQQDPDPQHYCNYGFPIPVLIMN